MAGPEKLELESASQEGSQPPPGHFLSRELESDCARFLEDVRTLVRRREQEVSRFGLGAS